MTRRFSTVVLVALAASFIATLSQAGVTPVGPDMAVSKVAKNAEGATIVSFESLDTVIWEVTVDNIGNADANSVQLTDTLPQEVSFVSVTPGSPTCTYSSGSHTVVCNLGTITPPQTPITVSIRTTVNAQNCGLINNQAEVNQVQGESENNTLNNYTVIPLIVDCSDVAIDKTAAPNPVDPGDTVTYTLTVTNVGQGRATGVQVSDVLDSGLQITGVSTTQGTCNQGPNNSVVCQVGTLEEEDTPSVVITIQAKVPTSEGCYKLLNAAEVTSQNEFHVTGPNSAGVQVDTNCTPNLIVEKSGPASAPVGTQISYTIQLTNNGTNISEGITVTDDLNDTLTGVQVQVQSGECSVGAGNVVTCQLPPLDCNTPPGDELCTNEEAASTTITISATVPSSNCSSISNNARAETANEPDGELGDNQDSVKTSVTGCPQATGTSTGGSSGGPAAGGLAATGFVLPLAMLLGFGLLGSGGALMRWLRKPEEHETP